MRKLTVSAMFTAFALLLSYIEAILPLDFGFPGMKLGLANLATVILLPYLGVPYAASVSLLRILLSSLLFGNPVSLLYSLAGGLLSFSSMLVIRRLPGFGLVGMSMTGGIFHNVGQIGVACLLFDTVRLAYYLPLLLVSGVATGCIIGLAAVPVLRRLPRK